MRRIRVTETRIVEYVPDFNDAYYKSHEITTLEAAMLADSLDVKNGNWTVQELGKTATYDVRFEITEED